MVSFAVTATAKTQHLAILYSASVNAQVLSNLVITIALKIGLLQGLQPEPQIVTNILSMI